MTESAAQPNQIHEVFPYLRTRDGNAAIEFYKQAFGAEEPFRLTEPSGWIGHAGLKFEEMSREELQRRFDAMFEGAPFPVGASGKRLAIVFPTMLRTAHFRGISTINGSSTFPPS